MMTNEEKRIALEAAAADYNATERVMFGLMNACTERMCDLLADATAKVIGSLRVVQQLDPKVPDDRIEENAMLCVAAGFLSFMDSAIAEDQTTEGFLVHVRERLVSYEDKKQRDFVKDAIADDPCGDPDCPVCRAKQAH